MFRRTALKLSLGLAMTALVMTTPEVQAQQAAARLKPVRTGYVPANGVNYYYEIYGRGAPLLVLHGGLGSIEMFGPILPKLAQGGAGMAPMLKQTPLYKSYVAVAPRPEDFPRLLDRMGEWMRTSYDWTEDVKKLKGPVMLVYGDADMIRLDHAVRFYQLLGGGLKDAGWQREHMSPNRLAILPNVTHHELFLATALVPTVLPFLNGERSAPVWAAHE